MQAKLWTARLVFFMAGIGITVWAIVIPYVKIRFHLGDGTLGLVLLAGGTGGVSVMPLAGMAVARWGSRNCIIGTALLMCLLLPALGAAPSPLVFTALLFIYGANFGTLDVAINAQGAVVEALSGRLHMSGFHACYSLGTLASALVASLMLKLGGTVPMLCVFSAAAVLAGLTQCFRLVPKSGDAPPADRHFARPNRRALVLGFCCYAAFMTEGACTDWSAIFLRFARHMAIDEATLGYAAFAVMTALARLTGDRLAMRLGQPAVLRLGVALGVVGFALAILVHSGLAGVIGFGLVGFGTGNMAPLLFSAASRVPGMAAHHSMPAVVAIGYAGFLTGPVMIGFVSSHAGLGAAFGVDAVLLGLAFGGARAVA
ncbi:MAG: MFS transporter [Rhodospirillales bacterium]|nr:MFS transporter [Rhodospirillales bacterium]